MLGSCLPREMTRSRAVSRKAKKAVLCLVLEAAFLRAISSFEIIQAMQTAPFTQRIVLQLAVVTALPGLPLLLLVVPIEKVLDTLGGALL